jgi:hypothetical protein
MRIRKAVQNAKKEKKILLNKLWLLLGKYVYGGGSGSGMG